MHCGEFVELTLTNVNSSNSRYLGSLRYIHQYRDATCQEDTVADATDVQQVVTALIHYMEENTEKHLTMEMLSRYSGYSASHMSLLFRRQTGMAPMAYFNKLKMDEACYLLIHTDMKVNQICHKLGIDDSYYFSRLFSKVVGMSPRAYRSASKDRRE